MTFRHIQTTCKECKSEHIYYDSFHDETFCNRCGLILQDNHLTLMTEAMAEDKAKEKAIRKLHYKKYIHGAKRIE